MGLKPEIVDCLMTKMEPRHPFPFRLHEIAVPRILRAEGSTAFIVNAPTGHGKTAAFTLPILQAAVRRPSAAASGGAGPCALVLTKNRELARQHQRKILEYAQGTLDTYTDGSRVDPALPLTAAGRLDLDKLALGDVDSLQVLHVGTVVTIA
jgi:superfamily II DNA/RNA helicase